MSNHQTITTANLSRIENSLSAINDNINGVYQQVASVEQQLEDTQSDLALLAEEFREYVRQDGLIKMCS